MRDRASWTPWFAWYPVRTYPPGWGSALVRPQPVMSLLPDFLAWEGDWRMPTRWVWLRHVERRSRGSQDYGCTLFRLLEGS